MGINQKFRSIDGLAKSADEKAENARNLAAAAAVHVKELALAAGYEYVREPVGENQMRIRYRRRLPRWLAWVRKVGVWQ